MWPKEKKVQLLHANQTTRTSTHAHFSADKFPQDTYFNTLVIIKHLAKQSGHPILSRVMTGAVLHGYVFWLDCHLEGCLRQPQGHQIQFTWKTTEKQQACKDSCSLSLTFCLLFIHTHLSVTFVSSRKCVCSPVDRHFTAPIQFLNTHTGRVGVRAKGRDKQSGVLGQYSKKNSWTETL